MNLSEVKHLPKVDHTPAELDEPSKILLRAAAVLEERGHCQDGAFSTNGSVCTIVAVSLSSDINSDVTEALNRLRRAARTSGPCGLITWNDNTPTESVISTFRRVALGG